VNAPGAKVTDPKKMPGASVAEPKYLPKMRDGWYVNKEGVKVVQSMHTEDGTFKGTKTILLGRGRIKAGDKIVADCKRKAGDEEPDKNCCCKHVLANEPDFKSQPSTLEERIAQLGHDTRMLPKYHPELNPIEQFWAGLKEYLRRVCGYSITELQVNVPVGLRTAVPLQQVQRYYRRVERFETLYLFDFNHDFELPAAVREYAMKKYKRHRKVPDTLLNDVTQELEAKLVKLQDNLHHGRGTRTRDKLEKVKRTLSQLKGIAPSPMEK